MAKIYNDSFLLKNYIIQTTSKYIKDEIEYDQQEVQKDCFQDILNLKNSLTLDKRAIAIGSNTFCNREEMFFLAEEGGWSHVYWVGLNHYCQLIINLLKPKSSLIGMPDSCFDLSAILAARGSEITFLNSFSLELFERYIYNHPEYMRVRYDYSSIDSQDIVNIENLNGKKFDFIYIPYVWLLFDPSLIHNFINILEDDGAIVVVATNDMMRMYKTDFHANHIYDILKYINDIDGIYNYHIPDAQGLNIITKKG